MSYNKAQNLKANIEALRVLHTIRLRKTPASEKEKELLASFTGFGGLKCVLYPFESEDDIKLWPASDRHLAPLIVELHALIREMASDDKEYAYLFNSIKNSVMTAFYTPDFIPAVLSKILKLNNLSITSILDPSAGIGVFPSSLSRLHPEASYLCYEKDELTGRILTILYPEFKTFIEGFETISPDAEKSYDFISSNIPFGNFQVYDPAFMGSHDKVQIEACKRIHNYFFLKGMQQLRSGGLLAYLTSSGVSDTVSNYPIRERLLEEGHLVAAIRLPDNFFSESSGIQVSSDIIILQKKADKNRTTEREKQFLDTLTTEDGIIVNKYFHLHPECIMATSRSIGTDQYNKKCFVNLWTSDFHELEESLYKMLESDFQLYFDKKIWLNTNTQSKNQVKKSSVASSLFDLWEMDIEYTAPPAKRQTRTNRFKTRPSTNTVSRSTNDLFSDDTNGDPFEAYPYKNPLFSFYQINNLVYDNGKIGYVKQADYRANYKFLFQPLDIPDEDIEITRDYIQLRDQYITLFNTEKATMVEDVDLRDRLNILYDAYVQKYGYLASPLSSRIRLQDASGKMIAGLERVEDGKILKSDIFYGPVAFELKPKELLDAEGALASSMNLYGCVNLPYMSSLSGKDPEALRSELDGKIWYNPFHKSYEINEVILSGDVVHMIHRLDELLYQCPDVLYREEIEKTIQALKESRPKRISFGELEFNLGERWIPTKLYEAFASELMDCTVHIVYDKGIDLFLIKYEEINANVYDKWHVRGENQNFFGDDLLKFAMMDDVPNITYTVGTGDNKKTYIDAEKTQLLHSKVDMIREEFTLWLSKQPIETKENLTNLYNDRFNCFVRPEYNGTHQTFPGLRLENLGYKDLYDTQKNAIWMQKILGGGIIDHEVGTGKTMIMCVSAYEMKRLGIIRKPLMIGLKANTKALAEDFRKAYPNARVLCPKESQFKPAGRAKLFNDIKNNNWDCIIITHDQFMCIQQSLEIIREVLQDEINDLTESLYVITSGNYPGGRMLKGLETRIANAKVKLSKLNDQINNRRDNGLPDFLEMGIDHIFVDESHNFKNLMFSTRHSRTGGIGNPKGSQKAANLLYAIRSIQKRTGRDLGATFLSGTIISNSLTELYLLFKYLRPRALERQKITCFDAWAAIYTQKVSEFEFNVVGQIVNKERFRYFIKVPELSQFYTEIADVKTAEHVGLKRPGMLEILKDDKQTPDQIEYNKTLVEFAKTGNMKLIGRIASDDNTKAKMLLATDLSRKMALDMRMISSSYEEHELSKISRCAQNVNDYYQKYNEQLGTQFVFTNLGSWKKDRWNVAGALKEKLVKEYGIPEHEIRFIQEFSNTQKQSAIEALNRGEIRIMIGGVSNLGTGVNAQERAVAAHHLTIPMKPSEFDQMNGRVVRKGNRVAMEHAGGKVDIIIYAVEQTLDVYLFNLLKFKQGFISQFKNNSLAVRHIDEGAFDENTGVNYSEYVAILSGNPDILQMVKLDKKIVSLESERRAFYREVESSLSNLDYYRKRFDKTLENINDITADYASFVEQKNADENYGTEGYTPLRLDQKPDLVTIEDIGEYLNKVSIQANTGGYYQKVGTVYGFNFVVRTETFKDNKNTIYRNRFLVEGQNNFYTHNNGDLARNPELAVSNPIKAIERIPISLESLERQNAKDLVIIKGLEKSVQRTWSKEEVLLKSKNEKKELEIQMAKLLQKEENIPPPEQKNQAKENLDKDKRSRSTTVS